MKSKRLRTVLFGFLVGVGVLLLMVGIYASCVNLPDFFFNHDGFSLLRSILSMVAVVAGTLVIYVGTRYVNHGRPLIENTWLPAILFIGAGLFGIIYDAVAGVFLSDALGIVLDAASLMVGITLFLVSTRRGR